MDAVAIGKSLLILGFVIAVIGLVVMVVGHAHGHLPVGRLPGDFHWKKDGVDVYFPLATCLVISVVLTLVLRLFRR